MPWLAVLYPFHIFDFWLGNQVIVNSILAGTSFEPKASYVDLVCNTAQTVRDYAVIKRSFLTSEYALYQKSGEYRMSMGALNLFVRISRTHLEHHIIVSCCIEEMIFYMAINNLHWIWMR